MTSGRGWPRWGSGRAGWYAYDLIDNRGHCSAERILPEYQNIGVGSVLRALPGARDVFLVAQCETERSLVLYWRLPSGKYQTTWAFVLEQPQPDRTRLIVRGRVAPGYHPYGLPEWLAITTGRLAHFIMQRKQLLGITRRAEAHELTTSRSPEPAGWSELRYCYHWLNIRTNYIGEENRERLRRPPDRSVRTASADLQSICEYQATGHA